MKKDELTDKDIFEYYNKIQNFAQSEIERVYKLFKILIWTVSIVFTVGGAISAFLIGKSVSDIKDKYEESLNSEFIKIKDDLKIQVDSIRDTVNERIENEFRKENISYLVEQKAKERVDIVADNLITKLVSEKIQPLESHVIDIEYATNKKLERLIFDYYLLQMDNDSRSAFTKILNNSRDKSYEFNKEATVKINEKISDLNKHTKYPMVYIKRNTKGIEDLDSDKIVSMYLNEFKKSERIYFLDEMANSKIDSRKKTEVFLSILKIETSLYNSERIGYYLVEILKLKIPSYDFEKILEYKN